MKARKRDGTGRAATRIFMRFVAPAATAMVAGILVAMVAAGCGGATSTTSLKGSPFKNVPVFADFAKAVGDSVAAVSLGHPADSSATAPARSPTARRSSPRRLRPAPPAAAPALSGSPSRKQSDHALEPHQTGAALSLENQD